MSVTSDEDDTPRLMSVISDEDDIPGVQSCEPRVRRNDETIAFARTCPNTLMCGLVQAFLADL